MEIAAGYLIAGGALFSAGIYALSRGWDQYYRVHRLQQDEDWKKKESDRQELYDKETAQRLKRCEVSNLEWEQDCRKYAAKREQAAEHAPLPPIAASSMGKR